jgi:hypothetical protein
LTRRSSGPCSAGRVAGDIVENGTRLIAVKAGLLEPRRDHAQEWMPFVLRLQMAGTRRFC